MGFVFCGGLIVPRFHDSRCVAGSGSRHHYACATPSCRYSEHSQRSEQEGVPARMWGKTDTDRLASVSCLDDSRQRLSMSSIPDTTPSQKGKRVFPPRVDKNFI